MNLIDIKEHSEQFNAAITRYDDCHRWKSLDRMEFLRFLFFFFFLFVPHLTIRDRLSINVTQHDHR